MAGSQRSKATAVASLLALAALVAVAQQCFVGPASSAVAEGSVLTRQAEPKERAAMPGGKSLFDRTKGLNNKIAEANGQNETDGMTDETWGIVFTVAGIAATWFFVSALQSMKPGA
mmetsp:Transcript_21830/g.57689  ORF Transcript_21830/g.57689 Transcript_21830/m.57689 type:complete len:116 (+) Transcript_21830:94-441(+)